ncbi:MAG: glucosaminidase domain-containing protein [Bacteroidota bacterium]|nr:glucosaminidase domain-containing protein [Bacteroidota bacterium]MED6303034.1 glucosaminidase domain-containing protein [Bacteroidota bacterium]
MTREQYIEQYRKDAIIQMHKHKIPASITMAQGILESSNGNSRLAVKGNNHFGIKCHNWDGKKIYEDDDKKNECFRKYENALASFEDHSLFLKKYNRYAFLFDFKITDYKAWAKGLKTAGYATNKKYADLLIKLIEENQLYELDKVKETQSILTEFSRNVYLHPNRIKYVISKEGETLLEIAKEFDMRLWQLYKYNDIEDEYELTKGEKIFIQPKKNKGKVEAHITKDGESIRSISQLYGIKLKKLKKRNKHLSGYEINSGFEIKLR